MHYLVHYTRTTLNCPFISSKTFEIEEKKRLSYTDICILTRLEHVLRAQHVVALRFSDKKENKHRNTLIEKDPSKARRREKQFLVGVGMSTHHKKF